MEPLLKMKEHQEKERQKILAAIQQKRLNQEEEIQNIYIEKTSVLENNQKKIETSFTVAEMLIYSRYLHKLKRDNLVSNELLKAITNDEKEKRKLLLEAARERKKYEKLRDKQRDKFYKAVKEHDNKESDESAISSFRLRKKQK